MNEIVVHGPNGVTIRFPAGTDPATIDRVMREATGTALPELPAKPDIPVGPAVDLRRPQPQPGTVDVGGRTYMEGFAPPTAEAPMAVPTDDYNGPAVPQEAPSDNRGAGERAFELGLQGAGAGIADAIGAPVDLANALFNLLYSGVNRVAGREVIPLVDRPLGGSQTIRDVSAAVAEPLGLETLDPTEMTTGERLRYDITRTGTAAATGGGAFARAASAARPVAGIQGTPRAVDALIAPYATSPGRTFSGDVAAGAGAGAGNFLYNELAPQSFQDSSFGPIGATFANIFGGVGGAGALSIGETLARTAVRNADNVVRGPLARDVPPDAASGRSFRRADVDAAAQRVQATASNPFEAQTQIRTTADALAEHASPSSLPTTGLLSDDVGLIMAENQARLRNPRPFIERDRSVHEAAANTVDRIAPASASGRQFTDEITNIDADRVGRAQGLVDESQRAIQDATLAGRADAEPLRMDYPVQARDEAALGIDRAVVDDTMRPMQDASSRMFADVDPDRTAMIDATGVVDAARRVRDNAGVLVDPATVVPAGLLSRIEKLAGEVDPEDAALGISAPAEVSVGDIVAVFPEINRAIDAAARAGNIVLKDNLQTLRDGLNAAIDTAANEGDAAAQRAVAARENWRNTLGSTFGRDQPTAYDLRRDVNLARGSRAESPPSQTAGQFLRAGQPERAVELRNILSRSKDPAAGQRAVHDYLLADLAKTGVIEDGYLRPDALMKWRDRWGSALDASPETRDMVDRLIEKAQSGQMIRSNAFEDLEVANSVLDAVQRDKGAFAFVIGNDPTNAVSRIFSSGDPERAVKQILEQIGTNTSAMDGFKASIREYLLERGTTSAVQGTRSGRNPVSFAKLDQMFKQHGETLAMIFSPEEMNVLQAGHTMLRQLTNRGVQALPGSQTAERTFARDVMKTVELGVRTYHGALEGGAIMKKIRLWADQLPNNQAAVDQLMQQAWLDPDLMMILLGRPVRAMGAPRYNRALNRLLGYTAGARDAQDKSTEEAA